MLDKKSLVIMGPSKLKTKDTVECLYKMREFGEELFSIVSICANDMFEITKTIEKHKINVEAYNDLLAYFDADVLTMAQELSYLNPEREVEEVRKLWEEGSKDVTRWHIGVDDHLLVAEYDTESRADYYTLERAFEFCIIHSLGLAGGDLKEGPSYDQKV